MGDEKSVTTGQIKKEARKSKNFKKYNSWVVLIRKEFERLSYRDKQSKGYGKVEVICSIILFVFSGIALAYGSGFGFLSFLTEGALLIQGGYLCVRKSDLGYTEARKWKQFKTYISEINKSDANLEILKEFIPYAEALNVNSSDMDSLKDLFKDSASMDWLYYYLIFDNINLGKNNQFSHCIYSSFGTGSNGTSGGASGGPGGGGGAGGGGAGGF